MDKEFLAIKVYTKNVTDKGNIALAKSELLETATKLSQDLLAGQTDTLCNVLLLDPEGQILILPIKFTSVQEKQVIQHVVQMIIKEKKILAGILVSEVSISLKEIKDGEEISPEYFPENDSDVKDGLIFTYRDPESSWMKIDIIERDQATQKATVVEEGQKEEESFVDPFFGDAFDHKTIVPSIPRNKTLN